MKFTNPANQTNSVSHDSIDVFGTINYTNRYQFYNAASAMITEKIKQAQKMRSCGFAERPVIHINLACPDEKAYEKQSKRFFEILEYAQTYGLIIETTIIEPLCLNSWAGKVLREYATAGFRNAYEDAYHYYYPITYNPKTKKNEFAQFKVVIGQDRLAENDLCDLILLNNGKIKCL